MKRLIVSILLVVLLLPNVVFAENTESEDARYIAIAMEAFKKESGWSEEDVAKLWAYVWDPTGPVVEIVYDDIYDLDGDLWHLYSFTCEVTISLSDGTYQFGDFEEFIDLVSQAKQRNAALQVLEQSEREKGDFKDWPEADRNAYLTEYGEDQDVHTSDWHNAFPGPELPQIWDLVPIAENAILAEYGKEPSDLQKLYKSVKFLMQTGDGMDHNIARLYYQIETDKLTQVSRVEVYINLDTLEVELVRSYRESLTN